MRTTGCWPKTTPATAVAEGWVWIVNWLAGPALTTTWPEVTAGRLGLVKLIVIVVATLCERLVKLATPPAEVRLVVPCNEPLPALRLALTATFVLLHRLPNWSSIRMAGCWPKTTPAVAVGEGCVWIVRWSGTAA